MSHANANAAPAFFVNGVESFQSFMQENGSISQHSQCEHSNLFDDRMVSTCISSNGLCSSLLPGSSRFEISAWNVFHDEWCINVHREADLILPRRENRPIQ